MYSGSSQLEIKSKLKEPLAGRARQFEIQRLSFLDYQTFNRPIVPAEAFSEMLIYGSYPEVALERNKTEKKLAIKDIYQSYNDLPLRSDQGDLFENLFLLELLHNDPYSLKKINYWRTTNQTEVDLIVSRGDSVNAIDIKWGKSAIPKSFKTIRTYYPQIETSLVSKNDFLESENPFVARSLNLI